MLELRLAVEVEAAALASERASKRDFGAVADALDRFSTAVRAGDNAIKEDFAFHKSIAAATGNSRFVEFLDFLGRVIIPRQTIRTFDESPNRQRLYLTTIEDEHAAILAALEKRSPDGARQAMRKHLLNSVTRYRKLSGNSQDSHN